MANIKIAQLTNQTTIADTDLVIVETATSTNKMTVGNLKELLGINSKIAKSTVNGSVSLTLSNASGDITCIRNEQNQVHVKINAIITSSVFNTLIANIPVGYRPSNLYVAVPTLNNDTGDGEVALYISASGDIKVSKSATFSGNHRIVGEVTYYIN